jgi:histone H3/H4
VTTTQPKKKQKRFKHGERALLEIRKYQKDTELPISKRPFSRLVPEITETVLKDMDRRSAYRWQATAMLAIHTSSEDYMVKVFEAAQLNAIHGKRVPKDMQFFDDNNN